jgi:hypothetical protein
MTVAEPGTPKGEERLLQVASERDLNSDAPTVALQEFRGSIAADLSVGADVTQAKLLLANAGLAQMGYKLHGAGFIVDAATAARLGLGSIEGLRDHIRPYRNGRDLADRPRGLFAIDLYPLTEAKVRQYYPAVYQHVVDYVKSERDVNNEPFRKQYWWWFGRTHEELRSSICGLHRFIVTTRTAKHRIFQFADAGLIAESKLVCVASPEAYDHGVLSGRWHNVWALAAGGFLEDRPTYQHSDTFDPFPFGLLTLIVSLEAIFLATFVMITQNREALRAEIRSQLDFETNVAAEVWIEAIGTKLGIDVAEVHSAVLIRMDDARRLSRERETPAHSGDRHTP